MGLSRVTVMSFSLNEIEATAKKAARGGGYGWGLAEEAGKAVRWLCAHGFDGCKALADLLETIDGADLTDKRPIINNGVWRSPSSELCPLTTGAALSDRAFSLTTEGVIIHSILQPLLLLPFVQAAARQLQGSVTITWPNVSAVCNGAGISWNAKSAAQLYCTADSVKVFFGGESGNVLPAATRAEPNEADLKRLIDFARRTYAPATEESRLLGAGAGTSDND